MTGGAGWPERLGAPSGQGVLLAVLGFLSFASVYSHVVVAPVLLEVGREFGVTTGMAGLLVAGYGLPGIVVALVAGPFSDRRGRKPFIFWGTVLMSVLTIAGALTSSFALLLATRLLAGVGASLIFPNVNAIVGDSFPYRERGRAMGTIIGMNQLATILGIPAAGIVAELSSWRLSLALVGVLGVAAALAIWALLPAGTVHASGARSRELYGQILSDASARGAIVSSLLGAMFWFTWATYLVAFFQTEFGLSTGIASTVALTSGLGVLAGSQLGGRIGERIGYKAIVGWSIVLAGILLIAETNLIAGVAVAALFNFLLSAAAGARFAANTALLSEQAPAARGTMMAVNSSIVSLGIVVGPIVGGVLIDAVGFRGLGIFPVAAALASGFVVWRFVTERTADLAAGEAIE